MITNETISKLHKLIIYLRKPAIGDGDYYAGYDAGKHSAADAVEELIEAESLRVIAESNASAAYIAQIRAEQGGKLMVFEQLLRECHYPLLVAKADAKSSGEQEDLEDLERLIRRVETALRDA